MEEDLKVVSSRSRVDTEIQKVYCCESMAMSTKKIVPEWFTWRIDL